MISEHTKGPLTVRPNVHGTLMVFAGNGSNEPFTEVAQPMDYYQRPNVLKERANLFAAAPELLAACDFLLAAIEHTMSPAWTGKHNWRNTEGYKDAILAISKAKGNK